MSIATALDLPRLYFGITELIGTDRDWYHRAGLAAAAFCGSIRIVEELLTRPVAGSTKDSGALRNALKAGHLEIAELLLKAGFNPNQTEKTEPYTPTTVLGRAARRGDKDMCSLLLRYGANVDLPDLEGQTPLMHAVKNGWRAKSVANS
jgi:ankyrin repeat protein